MAINHKPWMDEQHKLANQYYTKAIFYYEEQRNNFLKKIEQGPFDEQLKNNFLQAFNDKATDISATLIENTDTFRENVLKRIEEIVEELILNGKNPYKEIIDNNDSKRTKKDNPNYYKNYNERIKKAFNDYLLNDSTVKSQLESIYKEAFSVSEVASTSMQGMYSLFRRLMLSKVVKNPSVVFNLLDDSNIQGYIQLFKGYNAEKVAEKAGQELLSKFNWQAKQVGGTGGISDVGFAESNIQNLEEILQKIENSSQTLEIGVDPIIPDLKAYGLQAKSWKMPDQVLSSQGRIGKQFYEIGERSSLLSGFLGFGKQTWWHYNIVYVAKNLIKAIGAANIIYITGGNKYIWTADLIKQFREAEYLLSFYYRRDKGKFYYPPIATMTWQQEVENYGRGKYGNKDDDKKN